MQKTYSLLNRSYQRVRFLLMTTRRQSLFVICLIVIALAICFVPVAAGKMLESGKTTILVGGEIDYPPYSFLDENGQPTGFQVELIRAVAKTMGMNIEIRLSPWPEARKALEDGTIDVIPGMFYSEERAKIYDFSPPFSIVSVAIFARVNSPSVKSVEDLRNKEIIVMRGEVMHDYILKHRLTNRILLAETPADVLRLLASGKGDYAFVAQMPGFYWIKKLNLANIKSVGPSLAPFKNCFAVRKGNKVLLSRFTEGLNILHQTEEYHKLYDKWLSVLEPTSITFVLAVKYAAIVIVPLILLLAGSWLWTLMLRSKVNQKTKELKESEKQYRDLVENLNDVIYRLRMDGTIDYVSPTIEQVLGYTPADVEGKRFDFAIHPHDREKLQSMFVDHMHGKIYPAEYRMVARDGRERWVRTSSRLIMNGQQFDGMQGVLADITERKQAEEALHLFKDLVEHSSDAVGMSTAEGEHYYQNEAFNLLFGVIGDNPPEKVYVDKAIGKEVFDTIMSGGSWQGDVKMFKRDGTILDIFLRAYAIKNQDGGVLGLVGLHTDITESKRADEEKQILQERLNRSEKMEALGTLAGGVAHDLNNVLGIVVGYAELALDTVDKPSPLRHDLETIMNGGHKAAAIVDDLLTLARRGVSSSNVLNLNKIIADFQKSPELKKLSFHHPAVKIKTDLDSDLLNINGSSVHLSKSLYNLVSNANESMAKGGTLTIKTSKQYLDKPISGYDKIREGEYVVLSVADTGEGISANNLKRIFEPFYTKKVMGRSGTGLGLAVVWGTVKDHNGYINVQSEEGKGSIFTIYFPVTREEIVAQADAIEISEYMGKGETILVVDDVKEQRDLASGMLSRLNYNMSSVGSGEDAVEYIKNHKVDLIILDMIMDPGMDGLDTYKSILKIHPKQKAIIVSGFSESDRVRSAKGLGAGAYIKKPYIKERLGMAVKKELERV